MPIDWFPLWLSLRVASVSTVVALAAGLWIAYILANREFRGKAVVDAAVTLPLVLPPTVLGYYLLVALGRSSPLGKLWENDLRLAAGVHLEGRGGGRAAVFAAAAGEVLASRARKRRPQL